VTLKPLGNLPIGRLGDCIGRLSDWAIALIGDWVIALSDLVIAIW
jgi:hypothetical protein